MTLNDQVITIQLRLEYSHHPPQACFFILNLLLSHPALEAIDLISLFSKIYYKLDDTLGSPLSLAPCT